MNMKFRFYTIVMIMLAVTGMAWAQDDIDYEKMSEAENWYADRAESILTRFEGLRHNSGQLPQRYLVYPNQQAGSLGFAMAVATQDKREIIMFLPDGNDVKAQEVKLNDLPEGMYWETISNLGLRKTQSKDITLSERPLPVRNMNKAKNIFDVVIDHEEGLNPRLYNQMIFKPHQNSVRLASNKRNRKTDNEGVVIRDEDEFHFKLNTPSVVSKMFRGYEDLEASPWVVKSSFFKNHTLLQYSRWKEGEPIRRASADAQRIISTYYGGRKIKQTQWLASLPTAEREFYAVQFENEGSDALAALVCIAEGDVASSWEFHGDVDPATYQEGQSIWFVDDEGDFMPHAPEIHCMVATEEGLELYVRLYGGESVQYFILREIGSVLMAIQSDYWIYVWD